jgi:cytochrome oxidase Cu insertion factor (SCO1/SenC/PrrC family)
MSDVDASESPRAAVGGSSARPSVGAALPFFLSLAVLFAMAYGGWVWWRVQKSAADRGQAIAAPIGPPITDFEMTERSGEPFRSADMKGKVWVATFFFTTCPGNCIRLNQSIQLMHDLPELKDVTWVSITCDPDSDNLEALRDYADRWQADPDRWLFVRAPLEYTQQVAAGMKLALMRKGHQDYAVVFDKAGKIRGMFDAVSRSQCERMHTLLTELQKEEPPQSVAANDAEEKKPS